VHILDSRFLTITAYRLTSAGYYCGPIEYIIHRWAFHYEPKTEWGKSTLLVHGIHHDYPKDATRLVMPLLVSVPLALFSFTFSHWYSAITY
jgi:hypothetical protein